MWWLVITAIFAVVGIILVIVLALLVMKLMAMIQDMQPKIHAIGDRVERISDRVEGIAETVQGITGSARSTMDNVMNGANALLRSLTSLGDRAESGLTKFAPLLVGVKLASSLYQAFADRKQTKITANLPAKIELEAKS